MLTKRLSRIGFSSWLFTFTGSMCVQGFIIGDFRKYENNFLLYSKKRAFSNSLFSFPFRDKFPIEVFMKKRSFSCLLLVGLAAFGGVVLIAFDESLLDSVPALLWCGGMALAYGASTVISRSLKELDARVVSAWMALLATGPVLLLSFLFEEGQWQSVLSAGWVDWAMVLHAGIGVSVMGHVSMFALLRRYPIGEVMPYYVLTPIFGVLFSVILFDELLSAQILAGAAIVIFAIMTINRRAARDRRRLANQPARHAP